jgi:hypothetical protein
MDEDRIIKLDNSDLFGALNLRIHNMLSKISCPMFFIGILCAFLSFGYEVLVWFITGEWPNIRFFMLFFWFGIDSVSLVHGIGLIGIRNILLWFLELPLSVGFLLVGVVLGWGVFFWLPPLRIMRSQQ